MSQLENEYSNEELAYLALTSKVEMPIRDKLAFMLHQRLGDDLIVSREWKRVDLVVSGKDDQKCKVMIELKNFYTFDVLNDRMRSIFKKQVEHDIVKLKKFDQKGEVDKYTIILVTHPKSFIPQELAHPIIKYSPGVNTWFKRSFQEQEIKKLASKLIDEEYQEYEKVSNGCVFCGEAFGIGVDVLYWIHRH
jgi:hypothetical protein